VRKKESNTTLRWLKRVAKRIKKHANCPLKHNQALDSVAMASGYDSYGDAQEHAVLEEGNVVLKFDMERLSLLSSLTIPELRELDAHAFKDP